MKVDLIYKLDEMLGPVPTPVFIRRVRQFLIDRYPECEDEIMELTTYDYDTKTYCAQCRFLIYSSELPNLYKRMKNDQTIGEDMEEFGKKYGYRYGCGTGDFKCVNGRYRSFGFVQYRIEPSTFGESDFNNLYIRWSKEPPEIIMRTGFRNRDHFYCYKLGRTLNIIKQICKQFNIKCDDKTLLEKYIQQEYIINCNNEYAENSVKLVDEYKLTREDKKDGYSEKDAAMLSLGTWGRYLYMFKYDGKVFTDPMDSDWFPDCNNDKDKKAVDHDLIVNIMDNIIKYNKLNQNSSIEDVIYKVRGLTGVYSPVMCFENISPEKILFLWDQYNEICDNAGINGKYYENHEGVWKHDDMNKIYNLLK